MRHPHGLRPAAAGVGLVFPAIGAPYQGGFFAGYISHTANSVATHVLIVAPAATGASGTGYINTTNLQWKTSNTITAGTDSLFNGSVNSANMNNASHPAAQFCEGLSIGGYSDWYLPALYELDIAYQNLKPDTQANNTSWGINPYSVPARPSNRTAGAPAQTSIAAFRTGGAEAFRLGAGSSYHWMSTQHPANPALLGYILVLNNGDQNASAKDDTTRLVRAFRKVAV